MDTMRVPPGMPAPDPLPERDGMERTVVAWDHMFDTGPVGSVEYRWSDRDRKWWTRSWPP